MPEHLGGLLHTHTGHGASEPPWTTGRCCRGNNANNGYPIMPNGQQPQWPTVKRYFGLHHAPRILGPVNSVSSEAPTATAQGETEALFRDHLFVLTSQIDDSSLAVLFCDSLPLRYDGCCR